MPEKKNKMSLSKFGVEGSPSRGEALSTEEWRSWRTGEFVSSEEETYSFAAE